MIQMTNRGNIVENFHNDHANQVTIARLKEELSRVQYELTKAKILIAESFVIVDQNKSSNKSLWAEMFSFLNR